MHKKSIAFILIVLLGISFPDFAAAEKRISLECKLSQSAKNMYMRGEKYESCMVDGGFETVCLVELSLVAEFTKSFLVNTDVSNLSLRKDNSKQGSAYWWEHEALFYVRYFGNGETTFRVDRSDLSYLAIFVSKEGDEDVAEKGQCILQDQERKF
jgi:hypothetical protein